MCIRDRYRGAVHETSRGSWHTWPGDTTIEGRDKPRWLGRAEAARALRLDLASPIPEVRSYLHARTSIRHASRCQGHACGGVSGANKVAVM